MDHSAGFDGYTRRLKLTRVLWWAEGYAEAHQSALMATRVS